MQCNEARTASKISCHDYGTTPVLPQHKVNYKFSNNPLIAANCVQHFQVNSNKQSENQTTKILTSQLLRRQKAFRVQQLLDSLQAQSPFQPCT